MGEAIKALALTIGTALLAASWQSAPAAADSAILDRIQKEGEIRLAYRTDAAPFSYREDDKPAGYSVNLCLEVAAGLQRQLKMETLNATFIQVTAENRFEAITQGHADLLCEATTATLSRRETMDFSIPTFISGASLVILPNGPTSFDALAGQKVGVLGGTTTQKILEATMKEHNVAAEEVVVKTHDEGFDLVEKGAIAAYFGDRTILEDHLRDKKADNTLLLADSYLTIEPFALAMPIDHDFRLAVDTVLSRLFRSGGLIKVFRKSFAPEAKPSDLIKMLSRTSGLPD
ncbi:MAG TPA: amino acid ABC transporter substrate-binding protein [Dongiaceae bacterium]|jgi:polar amino acid transport system substrate-binding protein/glutamate/aspartate transport system substrate-binding protein